MTKRIGKVSVSVQEKFKIVQWEFEVIQQLELSDLEIVQNYFDINRYSMSGFPLL